MNYKNPNERASKPEQVLYWYLVGQSEEKGCSDEGLEEAAEFLAALAFMWDVVKGLPCLRVAKIVIVAQTLGARMARKALGIANLQNELPKEFHPALALLDVIAKRPKQLQ
jgi:hypothetical protein